MNESSDLRSPTGERVSAIVEAHVREILGAAERAGRELEREVEQASQARGAELRNAAERDAAAIRAQAQADATAYLEDSSRRVEAWANGRVTQLQELSDALLTQGEAIRARLPEAEELHRSLHALLAALATAARATAAAASRPGIDLPPLVADAPWQRRHEPPVPAPAPVRAGPDRTPQPVRAVPRVPRNPFAG